MSNLTVIQDYVEKGLVEDELGHIKVGIKFLTEGLNSTLLNELSDSLLDENSKKYFEAFEQNKLAAEEEFDKFLQIYESSLTENTDLFQKDYFFCKKHLSTLSFSKIMS